MKEKEKTKTTENPTEPNIPKSNSKNSYFTLIIILIFFTPISAVLFTVWQKQVDISNRIASSNQSIENRLNLQSDDSEIYSYIDRKYERNSDKIVQLKDELINSVADKIQEKLASIETTSNQPLPALNLLNIANIIQEANLNLNYWGNKEKAKKLLLRANTIIRRSEILADSEISYKISSLLERISNNKNSTKQEAIHNVNNISNMVAALEFDIIENNKREEINSSDDNNWKKKLKNSYEEIKSYIKVRNKEDDNSLMQKLNSSLVKEKLLLKLEAIKIALISDNIELYNNSLYELKQINKNNNITNKELYNNLTESINILDNFYPEKNYEEIDFILDELTKLTFEQS